LVHLNRSLLPLLVLALVATGCGLAGASGSDASGEGAPDPRDWDAVVAAAEGATVDLHMWGHPDQGPRR
jgi:hypothetical protein